MKKKVNIILKFLIFIPLVKGNNNTIKCINNINSDYFTNIKGCPSDQINDLNCNNYKISIENMKNITYKGLTDITTVKCVNFPDEICNNKWQVFGTLLYNNTLRIGNTHLLIKHMNLTTNRLYKFINKTIEF